MSGLTPQLFISFYRRYRIIILTLLVGLILFFAWPFLKNIRLQYFDFNVFYNAGYHTLRRIDPYGADWFLYPPWVIPPFLPFGLLSFDASRLLYYFVGVIIIFLVSDGLWAFLEGPKQYRWLAWLVGITFNPVIITLMWGQLSPLVLLGIFLFLKFVAESSNNNKRLTWAGLSTYWIALKIQVLYLFWPLLLLWSIHKRESRLIGASLLVITSAVLVTVFFVPGIICSYLRSILQSPPSFFALPTIGYWLRLAFGEERYWLQFIPPVFGCAWLVYYWIKKKDMWQWKEELPLLAFASLITTPHSWTHDYLILLPGILLGFIKLTKIGTKIQLSALILLWLLFNVVVVILHFRLGDYWFYWQIFILLGFFLATAYRRSESGKLPLVSP
jgi:hypothetical protein